MSKLTFPGRPAGPSGPVGPLAPIGPGSPVKDAQSAVISRSLAEPKYQRSLLFSEIYNLEKLGSSCSTVVEHTPAKQNS